MGVETEAGTRGNRPHWDLIMAPTFLSSRAWEEGKSMLLSTKV